MTHDAHPGDYVRVTRRTRAGVFLIHEGEVFGGNRNLLALGAPYLDSKSTLVDTTGDVTVEILSRALPTVEGTFIIGYEYRAVRSIPLQLIDGTWLDRRPDAWGLAWSIDKVRQLQDVVIAPAGPLTTPPTSEV